MNRQENNISFYKERNPDHEYREERNLKILQFTNQQNKPCLYIWQGRQKDPYIRYSYPNSEQRVPIVNSVQRL